jgi:hypothetical protein
MDDRRSPVRVATAGLLPGHPAPVRPARPHPPTRSRPAGRGVQARHARPVQPLGTLIGIYFLETGIIGLQLLGYRGWVQDAFDGASLVAAVTVAHLVRNRTRVA